jgi:hypothetical protein
VSALKQNVDMTDETTILYAFGGFRQTCMCVEPGTLNREGVATRPTKFVPNGSNAHRKASHDPPKGLVDSILLLLMVSDGLAD